MSRCWSPTGNSSRGAAADADVLIVDLTADPQDRIELVTADAR